MACDEGDTRMSRDGGKKFSPEVGGWECVHYMLRLKSMCALVFVLVRMGSLHVSNEVDECAKLENILFENV